MNEKTITPKDEIISESINVTNLVNKYPFIIDRNAHILAIHEH